MCTKRLYSFYTYLHGGRERFVVYFYANEIETPVDSASDDVWHCYIHFDDLARVLCCTSHPYNTVPKFYNTTWMWSSISFTKMGITCTNPIDFPTPNVQLLPPSELVRCSRANITIDTDKSIEVRENLVIFLFTEELDTSLSILSICCGDESISVANSKRVDFDIPKRVKLRQIFICIKINYPIIDISCSASRKLDEIGNRLSSYKVISKPFEYSFFGYIESKFKISK